MTRSLKRATVDDDEESSTTFGERIDIAARVIVSPVAGVFAPNGPLIGSTPTIDVGDVVGTVGPMDIVSPFAGRLMGFLTLTGKPVRPSEAVAWLEVEVSPDLLT